MQVQGTAAPWSPLALKDNAPVKPGGQMYGYYAGMFHAGRSIWMEQGLRGLFAGYMSTLARDVPFAGLMVMFYEALKDITSYGKQKWAPNSNYSISSSFEGLLLGGLAGVLNLGGLAMAAEGDLSRKERVKVGLLVDSNAPMGRIASSYVNMALSDFYEAHPSYRTRLSLHFRNPQNDVVLAASAALDLMQNEEVHAIIGPAYSSQAKFVIDLGIKAQVPIISFSATSPSLSPTQSRYFVRTAYDDCSQVEAIAALIQAFGWREIVPIYEDTDYGNGLIPYLTDAFQNINTRVPYRSAIHPTAQDIDILKELNKVMTMSTRVFLVHMTATLGSRLFVLANEAGMLNEESVWIVTDGLSSLLDPVGSTAMSSMQGVVGVRPYVPMSKKLKKFMKKQLNSSHGISPSNGTETVTLFSLWAYDTIWALAMVAEKQWTSSDQLRYVRPSTNRKMAALNFSDTGISEMGPKLLQGIINLSFHGLSGLFEMVHGQLQPSGFEIINVLGNEEKIIGYWTPKHGLSKAFPRGSPLVAYFSRAILNVTQDKTKMNEIERKYQLSQSSLCQDEESNQGGATISSHTLSLGMGSFSGLFIITGIVAVLAVLAELVKGFRTKHSLRKGIERKNSKVVPLPSIGQGDPNTGPSKTNFPYT
ncbi:hypothetical protein CDL15_Pgr015304 [Punica granatum]|uniref:Receptor ligand binding region domain-containing protein n=1 Tax=Punica granatum TaxID=22663 RepID=A0A218W034_PUNGR|nr:hypothetical protein CDL15_Pgr015304 [Punica granatum]